MSEAIFETTATTERMRSVPWLTGEAIALGLVAVLFMIWPDPIFTFLSATFPVYGPAIAAIFITGFTAASIFLLVVALAIRIRFR
jgi:hypothetical protein